RSYGARRGPDQQGDRAPPDHLAAHREIPPGIPVPQTGRADADRGGGEGDRAPSPGDVHIVARVGFGVALTALGLSVALSQPILHAQGADAFELVDIGS